MIEDEIERNSNSAYCTAIKKFEKTIENYFTCDTAALNSYFTSINFKAKYFDEVDSHFNLYEFKDYNAEILV